MATGDASDTPAARRVDLDDLDRAIVTALRRDGRASMRALAERLHVSRAGLYARVERLQADGVITGYGARIDPERYGFGLSAFVHVSTSQHSWKDLRRRVAEIPEVWHAALVSGQDDLVLLVRTVDAAHLRDLVLTRLQTLPGVVSTHTVLILDEIAGGERPADVLARSAP